MPKRAILQCLFGRLLLLAHSASLIAYSTVIQNDTAYALFGFLCLFQLGEAIYMVTERKGSEYTWVSVSTVCYLVAAVPPLWLVELRMLDDVNNNATTVSANYSSLREMGVGLDVSDKIGIEVVKQTLLVVIMLHRWIIPRGSISRDSLSHLLFVFFALSSDILELFELFDDPRVKGDGVIGYAVLAAWNLSLVQLCMVLTNTRLARRARMTQVVSNEVLDIETANGTEKGKEPKDCCHSALASDLWSILITLFTMDVPFLMIRLYIIVELKIATYGIMFFTVKNMLIIVLSAYRLVIIVCCRRDHSHNHGT